MKKKINIDRDPIAGEEIASKMNFNQLLSNFPGYINPPFYKTGWFITTVASVAILVTVTTTLLLNSNKKEVENQTDIISEAPPQKTEINYTYEEDTPCIKPPVKHLDIPTSSYYCNNEIGGKFKHPSGSVISVSKNTFVDKNGNPLTGEIELRYREFHDAVDFILSGIPMTYDSAGTEYTFESAGMIEVYGFQNGKPVEIADGKSIHIEMTPKDGSSRFNLYELDTVSGNWTFKGKPELITLDVDESTGESNQIFIEEVENEMSENNLVAKAKKATDAIEIEILTAQAAITEQKKKKPIKPKTSTNKDRQFELDVDAKEFPELKNYNSLTFEVDKNDKSFSTDVYNIEWDNISLSENKKGESYYLTLFKGSAKRTFSVHPIFKGEDYNHEMAKFDKQFVTYKKELDKRILKEKGLKEKLKKQIELFETAFAEEQKRQEEYAQANKIQFEQFKSRQKNTNGIQVVARAFNVTRFGTWNCDSPIAKPSGAKINASFADLAGIDLGLHHVNLIEKNKNAVFTYDQSKFKNFKFNPKEQNTIVGFTADNDLAIIQFLDVNDLNGKKHQFKMEIIDIKSLTVKNVKEILKL